jgi:hypothetical protein
VAPTQQRRLATQQRICSTFIGVALTNCFKLYFHYKKDICDAFDLMITPQKLQHLNQSVLSS